MQVSGSSAFSSGLSSIQSGQRRVDQAASEIANSGLAPTAPVEKPVTSEQAPETDLASSLVALQLGKIEVQAGAKVVDTADEVLGTLLDTRA